MEIVIALIISGLTALFISLPFFLRPGDRVSDIEEEIRKDPIVEKIRSLEVQKDSLYSAIRDIDLDFGLGKLTKEDYEELRQKYRLEAASVLRELDRITDASGARSLDDEIEEEIRKSRGLTPEKKLDDEIEKDILAARASAPSEFSAPASHICGDCGNKLLAEDIFCSKCGAKVKL